MRLLKAVGGSVVALYLVCCALAAYSIGSVEPVMADSVSSVAPVVVHEFKAPDVEVTEQSTVSEVADKIPDWLSILSTVVALASAIAAVTPSPKDNAVLIVLRKLIDVFALNMLGAKNASAVDAERKKNSQLAKRGTL